MPWNKVQKELFFKNKNIEVKFLTTVHILNYNDNIYDIIMTQRDKLDSSS